MDTRRPRGGRDAEVGALSLRRWIAISIGLALLLAGLTSAYAFTHLGSATNARREVGHTHRVIEQNQALFSLIQDAETGERGYLLTQDRTYLAPFVSASGAIPIAERRLARLVLDNPPQRARVADLNGVVSSRLAYLDRSVTVADRQGFAYAITTAHTGVGARAMVRIRLLSAQVSAAEAALLEARTSATARQARLNLALGLSAAALALFGLIGSVLAMAGAISRLGRARDEAVAQRQAREASDALTNAVFANSPDYLFVLEIKEGDRFVVGDVNPAFERALRVSGEAIRGKSIDELMPPDSAAPLIAHYRRVRAADAPVLTRDLVPALPGGPRTWESILAPVRNAAGQTDRIVGATRDITDRVKTEDRLRDAQRMEAVGQLTGGVAHDFNNLLQVIRGNLELLEPAVESDPAAHRRLSNALHGADRAAQLTRQLLAFARRQPLAPQVVNLSRLIGDMADLLRRTLGEGIEVETVVGGGLWNTLADPAQVESAILNLALNARDAMPGGGRLTVEVANAALDEAYTRDAEDVTPGQYVLIAVSDTGEGMSEPTRARVFEPFFTTKADGKGSGLGLSMVYGFVRQSNGHIRIYSEPGHGTTVKLYLPRTSQAVVPTLTAQTIPDQGAHQTVLVVEDEPQVRASAVGMLGALGYRCVEASDAASALEILKAGAAIDLVFTDVVMPGPLKTRDFATQVSELWPDLPILFTSGYTENAIVHHGRLDDGVNLLSKPYGRLDLARKVAQLLQGRGKTVGAADPSPLAG
ncbi:MAG TPA: CHASE3 domain-containing protein, partial [Caulobacteraceae bacterium]